MLEELENVIFILSFLSCLHQDDPSFSVTLLDEFCKGHFCFNSD